MTIPPVAPRPIGGDRSLLHARRRSVGTGKGIANRCLLAASLHSQLAGVRPRAGRYRYGGAWMPGSVQRLPNGQPGDEPPVPPADVYRAAIEEYRFQTTFNWSRTQYLLAFNAGLLTAAVVASQWSKAAALAIYVLGAASAGLAIAVVRTQHVYYRAARDRMRRVEELYAIPSEARFDTTATLGGRTRMASVNTLVLVLLGSMIVANVIGAIIAVT